MSLIKKLLDLTLDTGQPIEMNGRVNVSDEQILANIAYAVRQGHPQVQPQATQSDRVLLVAGGPSLDDTKDELIDLHFQGAKIFTVNGAYHWCLAHHLRPSAQIVVDARDHNVRFVEPEVPQCRYLLASQCAPSMWDAVKEREHVHIWHALGEHDADIQVLLDAYYLKRWHGIAGGTTVAVRALVLLRLLGYVQFDVFGVDSCWGPAHRHHAYAQPENDSDKRLPVKIAPTDQSHDGKEFWVSPWHLVQFENFLHLLRHMGDEFGRITVHGDGMLAYAMHTLAGADFTVTEL